MKICGYCNNEYDDKETKCPVCGSTILKHTKNTASAKAEYEGKDTNLNYYNGLYVILSNACLQSSL